MINLMQSIKFLAGISYLASLLYNFCMNRDLIGFWGYVDPKIIKENKNSKTKIIFSSSIHNKEEILSSGADLYLPKPYDINELIMWVERYMG